MKQLEHKNDQLQSLTATQSQQLAAQRSEHADQLAALRAKLHAAETVTQRQHAELTELRSASEALRSAAQAHAACPQEASNAQALVRRLQSHINQLASDQQQQAAAAAANATAGERAIREHARLLDENGRLVRQLAAEQTAHQHAKAAREALADELTAAQQRREQDAVQLQRQRDRLTAELTESTDAVCALNADCARQRSELEEVRGRQESMQSTYAQLHARLVQDWDALRQRADERMLMIKRNAQKIRDLEVANGELRTQTERTQAEVIFEMIIHPRKVSPII